MNIFRCGGAGSNGQACARACETVCVEESDLQTHSTHTKVEDNSVGPKNMCTM